MARLASVARMGYYPLHFAAARRIVGHAVAAPPGARMLDPCAGAGDAAALIAAGLGITAAALYLNEHHPERAEEAQAHSGQPVLQADALTTLQCAPGQFQVVYANPPFDEAHPAQGGERGQRLEVRFWRRIVEEGRWLQPGGLMIMVAPEATFLRSEALAHLARCYDDVRLYRLPDELRPFNELVAFGVCRRSWRTAGVREREATRLREEIQAGLLELPTQAAQPYAIPAPQRLAQIIWRDSNAATPEQAHADLLATGGAWASRAEQARLHAASAERTPIRPLFPLTPPQAILRIASGSINGQIVTLDGRAQLLKGTTTTAEHRWVEEHVQGDETIIEEHCVERPVPLITTIDPTDGAVTRYQGEAGMRALLDLPGAAADLVAAVARSAPPRYTMQIPPAIVGLLDGLLPQSGRALPGQEPGLVPMQRHLVAALWSAYTTPAEANGRPDAGLILSADMGCGKTTCAIAVAEALEATGHGVAGRAFTALVLAPPHLIGERGVLDPLPPWLEEWSDLLPHWHIEILDSPAQVAAFFAGATSDPETPRVGLLAMTKASLASGWAPAAVARPPAPTPDPGTPAAALLQALDDEVLADRERMGLAQERQGAAPDLPPGVSPRTIARDRLLRCGVYGRAAMPLSPFDGIGCPDCGRRVPNHSQASLERAGIIGCPACGARLGQVTRAYESPADRGLPCWRAMGRRHPDLPWGVRPASNPRVALADYIARRFRGRLDLLICDEVHLLKGKRTARGAAFGKLAAASRRTLGLTGTFYGGRASTVFALLQRLGNRALRQEYAWSDESRFVQELGTVDTITRTRVSQNPAQALSGKADEPTVQVVERPGISARLAEVIQSQAALVLLRDMGFTLPDYAEDVAYLTMPGAVAEEYAALLTAGRAILRAEGGNDALSTYLQATLTYCLAPWRPVAVQSVVADKTYLPPALDPDLVLPHHEWLADLLCAQHAAGRRSLIFVEHTNRLDLMPDVQQKVVATAWQRHRTRLNIALLRSTTVSPGRRAGWFRAQEERGVDAVLCHPRLVETGLNLIGYPEIVFLEPTYQLATLLQARKRAMRPTQTRPCRVTHLAYRNTMMAQAIAVVGRKAAAAALLSGDALAAFQHADPSMSLLHELSRRISAEADAPPDPAATRALFHAA